MYACICMLYKHPYRFVYMHIYIGTVLVKILLLKRNTKIKMTLNEKKTLNIKLGLTYSFSGLVRYYQDRVHTSTPTVLFLDK